MHDHGHDVPWLCICVVEFSFPKDVVRVDVAGYFVDQYCLLPVLKIRKRYHYSCLVKMFIQYTDKPVLRGHLWDKEMSTCKTDDLLKEVQFI
jgi:hypothetical protein